MVMSFHLLKLIMIYDEHSLRSINYHFFLIVGMTRTRDLPIQNRIRATTEPNLPGLWTLNLSFFIKKLLCSLTNFIKLCVIKFFLYRVIIFRLLFSHTVKVTALLKRVFKLKFYKYKFYCLIV